MTGRELRSRVSAISSELASRGLGRTDVIAVTLPNGILMAKAFLGVAAHATCAPLNPAFNQAEFTDNLKDLGAAALVVPRGEDSAARTAALELGIELLEFPLEPKDRDEPLTNTPAPDDIVLILHTSGTTSRPKQVPLSHRNLLASAAAVAGVLDLREDDIALNVMSLFHIHGIVGVLLASLHVNAGIL